MCPPHKKAYGKIEYIKLVEVLSLNISNFEPRFRIVELRGGDTA
jgi:hypothetical protein